MCICITFTVFFEAPFWVGIAERTANGQLEAAKVTFGAEPKDYEIYDFLLHHSDCLQFSPPLAVESIAKRTRNPKALQRAVKRQIAPTGIGTKAQEALKEQHLQHKLQIETMHRSNKETLKQARFQLQQQKKKAKHRGH